ncbi:SGNH/GDSL hydrolase family protein, partial [Streptomyces lydicus]
GRSSGDGRTGAHAGPEPGGAFWVSPADQTDPGPVTGWGRAGT